MTEPMPTGLDPAPPSADRGADAPAVLEALAPAPIVCLPHVGAMLPLRLRSAPAGPLRLRLQWRDGGLAREVLVELPDGPPGERALRVELDGGDLRAGRYDMVLAAETQAGMTLAALTLTAELHDFASVPPSAPIASDTLRRRSLAALPPVPLGAAPPGGDARIVLREAVPTPRAAWDAGDLERMAAAGVHRKALLRVDLGAPLSVFALRDAALLGPNLLIATPEGLVDESWGGAHPNASAAPALAAFHRSRPVLPRAGTVALALPTARAQPTVRSLRGFNHYHLHTEHLCSLLQIEALVRAWPCHAVETLLPAYDQLHEEALALLHPDLGKTRPIGVDDMRADRVLIPSRSFHDKAPDPFLADVFARIRRNALAGPGAASGAARVYVSRFGSAARRMRNEEELAARMVERGFEVFDARGLGYRDQVLALAGARIIAGPHGAGLTNIGFAAPDALLVEVFSPYFYSGCFQNVAAIAGHRYRAFAKPGTGAAAPARGEWDLDIPAFLGFLDHVLEAEERRGDSQALP